MLRAPWPEEAGPKLRKNGEGVAQDLRQKSRPHFDNLFDKRVPSNSNVRARALSVLSKNTQVIVDATLPCQHGTTLHVHSALCVPCLPAQQRVCTVIANMCSFVQAMPEYSLATSSTTCARTAPPCPSRAPVSGDGMGGVKRRLSGKRGAPPVAGAINAELHVIVSRMERSFCSGTTTVRMTACLWPRDCMAAVFSRTSA